ncbi:GNAT family N-acetyltransferase [Kitasatospora sp. MAP5-34]|uniref:GNAT family N-acetyltransferase n=1 Tax=Kitasatospora sp. MAP5-34 TaxID=3035102 RepID=UPI0024734F1A|nr:GNAT family N-acetyltransferase [Kitasatospora sp. MAP5-34]MDH6574750.1 hypothetical protein [Kitasatospora sp. MAP5-34]
MLTDVLQQLPTARDGALPRRHVHGHAPHPILATWFTPEAPGPATLAAHALLSGCGGWWTDRPVAPRAALLHCGPHRVLRGDPRFLDPEQLAPLGRGQFDAPDRFLPLLGRTFSPVMPWVRLVCTQQDPPRPVRLPDGVRVRPLAASDTPHLDRLDPRSEWISETWGSGRALADCGNAWGAFADGQLVSVACTYLRGLAHEDVAVVTAPPYRRLELGLACVSGVTSAIRARGRTPTWTVPRSNEPSLLLAEAAGFRAVRTEVAYWVGPAA